ncbi:MAG TPA: hypothetical protein VII34_00905 [Pyrinomonadaceae bacterium]
MRFSKDRRRKIVVVSSLLVALGMVCAVPLALAQSQRDESKIRSFIAQQAKRERATEYEEARSIVRGDLNADSAEDAVVLYTLEGQGGSNQYVQYLAVFLNRKGKLVYATHQMVGGKNRKSIESVSIKDGKINLQTLEYLPTDASCCPSKKGQMRFILSGGRLKKI